MNQADGGNVIFRFKGDTKDLDKSISGTSSSFKGMTKSLLAATGITKAVSAGFNLISSSMDTAISRYDTINNFPKVMKNFGVSTEEASKSVDRIADSVLGLPTSLDQAVAGVQNIFMVTKDLKKAEDMFNAVNHSAMVFANGSTEAVDRFIYAYKQAMSSGKVMAQDFNQMNEAIPGVMDKVAEVIGVTYAELKEGLSNGSISMEQFNDALKTLDTEGVGSMQAMKDAAFDSTDGIKTAMTNLHSRVAAGIAEMIKAVNKGLKDNGLGNLATVFSNLGTSIKNTLISLAPYITKAITLLVNFGNWVNKNKTWLTAIIVPLTAFIATFATIMKIISIIKSITTAMAMLNAVMLANPIVLIIAAVVALIAIFVLLWNKCDWFRNFWIGLWDGIVSIVSGAIDFVVGLFKGIIDFISNNWQALLLFLVNPFAGAFKLLYDNCEGFRNFVNGFVNKVVGFFKSIPGKLVSMAQGIINVFASLPGQLLNIGKNIAQGLWNGLSGMKDWVINKVKNMGKSILNSLKSVLGIHSPSTETEWMAKMTVVGYTDQLDKMRNQLQSAINDTFAISPQLANNTSTHFSPNVVVNNSVTNKTDPLGQVVTNIKTFAGGAKNDFNYGMGG